jgi:hypothetical protein
MAKLCLISIILISLVVPLAAAPERNPRLALRKAVAWSMIGFLVYLGLVLFVYPHVL